MTAQRKHLVLHIEIPGFYADDLDRCAGYLSEPDPPGPQDRLYIVTEEWMRAEVGVTLVGLPGEKCMSDDFEVRAYTGRIVGAETRNVPQPAGAGARDSDTQPDPYIDTLAARHVQEFEPDDAQPGEPATRADQDGDHG